FGCTLLSTKRSRARPARVRTPPVIVDGNGKGSEGARAPTPNGLPSRAMKGSRGSMIHTVPLLITAAPPRCRTLSYQARYLLLQSHSTLCLRHQYLPFARQPVSHRFRLAQSDLA